LWAPSYKVANPSKGHNTNTGPRKRKRKDKRCTGPVCYSGKEDRGRVMGGPSINVETGGNLPIERGMTKKKETEKPFTLKGQNGSRSTKGKMNASCLIEGKGIASLNHSTTKTGRIHQVLLLGERKTNAQRSRGKGGKKKDSGTFSLKW